MSSRLGIDVGGSFTDLLLFDDSSGALHSVKTPSTPQDFALGILAGVQSLLKQANVAPTQITGVLHTVPVAADLVLKAKGATVGLLVTEHIEQVLHLTPTPKPPAPLADLEHTRGIAERIDARGAIIKPLDEAQARVAIRELLAGRVEAIAVALLHAHANPEHERRLRALIAQLTAANPIPVSLSSDLVAEPREYERTVATVLNAYVYPGVGRYLDQFERNLSELHISPRSYIMRSDGGVMGVRRAVETPVQTLFSGPASRARGAAWVAGLAGCSNALGCDVGGASAELSLIQDGKPLLTRHAVLGHYPVSVPAVAVRSVAAGGGSIATVLPNGALQVGPRSAGAVGPACFGRGGEQATVTDAQVVLGRLPPTLLGGEITLDTQAAAKAVAQLGHALGLDTPQAAQAILDLVNEQVLGALRQFTAQQGLEPHACALVACGGAGPLHANVLAMLAGCYPVIVPPTPGVLSALGLLAADVSNEFAQAILRNLDDIEPHHVQAVLATLESTAKAWLDQEGIGARDQQVRFEADLRYFRQGHELSLPLDPGSVRGLAERFGAAHTRRYGCQLDAPIELVTLRAVGQGQVDKLLLPKQAKAGSDPAAALVEQCRVYFDGQFVNTKVYQRGRLTAGNRISGPAIIVQPDSTTVIHPGHVGAVDEYLNILINSAQTVTAQGSSAWR